jgi:hypothetical protein
MDESTYRKLVGDQGATLEERIHAAGVKIELTPAGERGWICELKGTFPQQRMSSPNLIRAVQPRLSTALWVAARAAGFTEGLDPPPGGVPASVVGSGG